MIISVKYQVQPFDVPGNVVLVQQPTSRGQGFKPAPRLDLKELDARELSAMCDDFRRSIFKRSEKLDPALEPVPVPVPVSAEPKWCEPVPPRYCEPLSAAVELGLGPRPYFGKPAQKHEAEKSALQFFAPMGARHEAETMEPDPVGVPAAPKWREPLSSYETPLMPAPYTYLGKPAQKQEAETPPELPKAAPQGWRG